MLMDLVFSSPVGLAVQASMEANQRIQMTKQGVLNTSLSWSDSELVGKCELCKITLAGRFSSYTSVLDMWYFIRRIPSCSRLVLQLLA